MPLIRRSPQNATRAASDLLAHLQIGGYLDHLEIPLWAEGGTAIEELIQALWTLGDGRWLMGEADDGPEELAERWLAAYLNGEEVPCPSESSQALCELLTEPAGDDLWEAISPLCQYAQSLGSQRKAFFIARLRRDMGFARRALGHMAGLFETLAACAYSADVVFSRARHSCLEFWAVLDLDLRRLSLACLDDPKCIDELVGDSPNAAERGKVRLANLARQVRQTAKNLAA